MKKAFNPPALIGFVLSSVFAFTQKWSLPEFCWSVWLAVIVFTWGCVFTAPLQIILSARSENLLFYKYFPALRRINPGVLLPGVTLIGLSAGYLAFYIYSRLFGFYGIFLSTFAQMEPKDMFGPNGFINSDFFTPVMYLIDNYWPMAVGILLVNWENLFLNDPVKRLILPFQKEFVRLHVMIIAMPFITLIFYALFRKSYQPITIVILLALLYFFPQTTLKDAAKDKGKADGTEAKMYFDDSVKRPGVLILPVLIIVIFAGITGFYTIYPAYIRKMDLSTYFEKPRKTSSSKPIKWKDTEIDEELRQILRKDHNVWGLMINENGLTYSAAPDGIFAFAEITSVHNPASLMLNQTFSKDLHFEVHKMHDGDRLIGFISNETDKSMAGRRDWRAKSRGSSLCLALVRSERMLMRCENALRIN